MILLYGILGACIAGVPLAVMLVLQSHHSKDLKAQVSYYRQQEEESRYLTVWTLKKDISAGEQLTEADMEKKEVRITGTEDINSVTDIEQLKGLNAKTALAKGTIIQPDLLYEGDGCTDDMRLKEITFVQLPSELKQNEYVDIRISFPDGEDYIVVKHKRVLGILQENTEEQQTTGIRLELTEEELLRLSAARIDVSAYANTALYAIQYRQDFQAEAIPFYPINDQVLDLLGWDPNVTERSVFSGERKKRAVLERNLVKYQQEVTVLEDSTQQGTVTEPSEDISEPEETSELEIFE